MSAEHQRGTLTRVFVYGTLLAGEGNHRLLRRARFVSTAKTPPAFELRDLGYYPGMVLGGAYAVVGEIYEVDAPTLAELDRLEGHPSFYQRTSITLEDGENVESYLLTPEKVRRQPIIASGSWRAYRKERSV